MLNRNDEPAPFWVWVVGLLMAGGVILGFSGVLG